jgi:hypothetical protein
MREDGTAGDEVCHTGSCRTAGKIEINDQEAEVLRAAAQG